MDAVIHQQITFFSQMAQPFNWKLFEHDNAAFLEERLKAHGFERVNDDYDVIMVLDLEDVPERLLLPVTKDVLQLIQAEQIWDVVNILDETYGEDFSWLHQRMGPIIEIPDYLNLFAGYEDGKEVSLNTTVIFSTLYLLFSPSFQAQYSPYLSFVGLSSSPHLPFSSPTPPTAVTNLST